MQFPNTLKQLMDDRDLKQADISRMTGIPTSLISNYMKGQKFPSLSNSIALARALNVSIDDLAGIGANPDTLPDEALKVARDYNGLDSHGKSITRLVISEEQKRMDEEAKAREVAANIIPFTPKKKTIHKGIVTLEVYEEPPAAGTGNYVSDTPSSHMEQYPEEYVPDHTDFGLIVSGRSMEPKYPDGSVVFIKSTPVVEPGEVGIFVYDGQSYIKELRVDQETGAAFLHSLNPEYSDIEVVPYVEFRPQGKVLGGYDPATGKVIWK